jgi:hypothetical protein
MPCLQRIVTVVVSIPAKEVRVFNLRPGAARVTRLTLRPWRAFSGIAIVTMLLAACGGDEGAVTATPTTQGVMNVVIATMTPVPPDYTPEIVQTQAAEQTAAAQTATAAPPTTPTPDVGSTPGGSSQIPEGAMRPAELLMIATGGQVSGDFGSYVWCDEPTNTCAEIRAPWVDLSGNGISWGKETTARFTAPNSPYALVSATVSIYTYDGNIVIPTSGTGSTADHYAFVAQTDPLYQQSHNGPEILLNVSLNPGFHIIEVAVNWQTPQGLPKPLTTQYAFVVEVV